MKLKFTYFTHKIGSIILVTPQASDSSNTSFFTYSISSNRGNNWIKSLIEQKETSKAE